MLASVQMQRNVAAVVDIGSRQIRRIQHRVKDFLSDGARDPPPSA